MIQSTSFFLNKRFSLLFLVPLALAPASASAKERTSHDMRLIAQRLIAPAASRRAKAAGHDTPTLRTLATTATCTVMGYDQGGFAIIANDDAHAPVVGYSATQAFTADNPAMHWFLSLVDASLSTMATNRRAAVPDGCKTSVDHLVQTQWSQDAPYWAKCPKDATGKHCYTGCVATAMAQIMRYYKWPATGIGRDTAYYNRQPYDVDFSAARYDYDNMPASYAGSYTVAQKLAVATLMYHCGVATSMTYGTAGSGAYLTDAARGLENHYGYITRYYGYKDYPVADNYDDQAWRNVVYQELSAGHPVLYAGASDKNGTENMSYHAFVLDGYDADGLVGVNWGFGGVGDGFFSLDVLECKAYSPSEQYALYHEMVVVHHPDAGAISYPLHPVTAIGQPATPESTAPVRRYDVAGRQLHGAAGHGLVIVKQGHTARKVLVK